MGWFVEKHPGHEGYLVGLVTREGTGKGSGVYRELAFPADNQDRKVEQLSAGCDCGWRSPRFEPMAPANWAPFTVTAAGLDEERVRRLWLEHVEQETRRGMRRG